MKPAAMSRFGIALAAGLALSFAAAAAEPRLEVAPDAAPLPVFTYARDACDRTDVPDVAARAWRGSDGQVNLVASHAVNRRMRGPELDQVGPACDVIYRGAGYDAPEAYDDRSWLSAPYTLDGRIVHALVSNEFHGQRRPELCPVGRYELCWRNVLVLASSIDGGAQFHRRPDGAALVAGLPYRYRGDEGRRSGIFSPSNIVLHEGQYYAFVWAEALGVQKRGACLMRTQRLDDPKAWRAFDGQDFTIRFTDPYREPVADPTRHVCAPVASAVLTSTVRSLAWHVPTKRWIGMLSMARPKAAGAPPVAGIWWSTSPDLLRWTAPRLLWAVPLLTHLDCDRPDAYYYPSLLDPTSQSRNFETVGTQAYLYLTRLNLEGCRITWNRDLVRLPVRIAAD